MPSRKRKTDAIIVTNFQRKRNERRCLICRGEMEQVRQDSVR